MSHNLLSFGVLSARQMSVYLISVGVLSCLSNVCPPTDIEPGQHIAASILSTVRKIGLDLSNLVILFPYISIRIRSHICLGWPRL